MSLQTLEDSIARSYPVQHGKGKKPTDFYSDSTLHGVQEGYGGEYEQNQYDHYRETYYAASRLIVHRLCDQKVFVGKRGVSDPSRSLSSLVDEGWMPPGEIPSSILDPSQVEVYSDHPFLKAWEDPNDFQNSFNLKEMLYSNLMAAGRGFVVCFVNRGRSPKRRFEFYAIPSTWMRPSKDGSTWNIKPPGSDKEGIPVPDSQVCQLKFSDPSNIIGAMSRMIVLGKTILTDEAIQSAQYGDFKNPMPKMALIAGDATGESNFTEGAGTGVRPVRLTAEQRRDMITWFRQQYAGVQKFGLPIILDAVIRDIKSLSRTPQEMAFLESGESTSNRIYNGIGVSSMLNGNLEKANRDSALLAEQFFVTNTANPIVNLTSSALTQKFGKLFSVDGDLIIWMVPLVAKDTDLDIQYLKEGRLTYSLTRNEWRAILRKRFGGLPKIDGWDDVVMPQTLDQRDDGSPTFGVGRQ